MASKTWGHARQRNYKDIIANFILLLLLLLLLFI